MLMVTRPKHQVGNQSALRTGRTWKRQSEKDAPGLLTVPSSSGDSVRSTGRSRPPYERQNPGSHVLCTFGVRVVWAVWHFLQASPESYFFHTVRRAGVSSPARQYWVPVV